MARPEAGAAGDARASILRIADALGAETLAIHVDLPAQLPPVAVPASTLEAVLTTLIDNSRQAGASSVTIKAGAPSGIVLLSIADDGRGVSEGDRERLFEPFFTTKRESGGSGLGLSIARSLLAASRGEIRLAQSLEGACFEITIPISRAPRPSHAPLLLGS
jgi:signal transduction histidine kinase